MKCRGMGKAKKGGNYASGGVVRKFKEGGLTVAQYDKKQKIKERIEKERQSGINKGFIKGEKTAPPKTNPKKKAVLSEEEEEIAKRPGYFKK